MDTAAKIMDHYVVNSSPLADANPDCIKKQRRNVRRGVLPFLAGDGDHVCYKCRRGFINSNRC